MRQRIGKVNELRGHAHAWARRAWKPSTDLVPGLGSGELDLSSPPAECARTSTPCASLILSSSCSSTQNRAGGRVCKRLLGYFVVAHHLGEEEQWHYLFHVLLEEHAGELSDANRRIHCL